MKAAPHSLDDADFERLARRIKAMASPVRLSILCHLANGEMTPGDLCRQIAGSQAGLSRDLAMLSNRGLVQSRRDGSNVFYALANTHLVDVIGKLRELYCTAE